MPTDTQNIREASIEHAAKIIEGGFEGFFGTVQMNLQDGHIANVNVTQTFKRAPKAQSEEQA